MMRVTLRRPFFVGELIMQSRIALNLGLTSLLLTMAQARRWPAYRRRHR
jgi:hypothetical protein